MLDVRFYCMLCFTSAIDELSGILDKLVRLLEKYGIMGALIVIIIAFIKYPEIPFKISAFIASIGKRCFRRLKKVQIQNEIRGDLLKATRTLSNMNDGFFAANMSVEFVKNSEKESFIREGKVIVRMSDTCNKEKNFVIATAEYIKNGFIQTGKFGFHKNLKKASDAVAIRKIIDASKNNGLTYFLNEFYPSYIHRDKQVDTLYNDLLEVDKNGMFLPILARLASFYVPRVRYPENDDALKDDFKNVTSMLIDIAKRERHEYVPLQYNGTYVKVAIILAIKIDTPQCIEDVLGVIQDKLDKGIEMVYIMALGRKISAAKEIANRAHEIDERFISKPLVTQYVKDNNGSKKCGICIELSTHHSDNYDAYVLNGFN